MTAGWDIASLPWLPAALPDLRARLRAAQDGPSEAWVATLRQLASHRLADSGLNSLARGLKKARRAGAPMGDLRPVRLGLAGNGTTKLLAPAIEATGLRFGLDITVVEAGFDSAAQELLDPNSALHRASPDVVLLALDHRAFPLSGKAGNEEASRETVARAMDLFVTLRDGLAAGCGATAIVQTVPPPAEGLFGGLDGQLPGTARWLTVELSRELVAEAARRDDVVLDLAALAGTVGLDRWHDPGHWNAYRLPFSQRLVPLWADHLVRLLAALQGRSRKVLVLDLDNTVWGGVIGDDGLDGIVLGQGDGAGEAHLAVQRTALALRKRGVVLAVCSKNTDSVARTPFREHPDMLLREEHIAVFQANWTDKASNLEAIARRLELGLDSLVFLDDNPFERAHVREALPMVAVPELPDDPALYVRALLSGGWFDVTSFTTADRGRADQYRTNAQRAELRSRTRDLGDYLSSLDMKATVAPFDALGRARIVQLIGRSNQYNLTTHRYAAADVAALQDDEGVWTAQIRLADSFGDNGMVSVVICRDGGTRWEIDTWLMSCRVLGRRLEERVLDEVVADARAAGAEELLGRWIPTDRNALVEDHYSKLGFERSPDDDGPGVAWRLALVGVSPSDAPIAVERR
jgi:FkbH-like protein